jgi:hypothetical protein
MLTLDCSYVVSDPNMPSDAWDLPKSRSLDLTVNSTLVQLEGSVRLAVSLPEPAHLWLWVYGIHGRLMRMFEDGGRLDAGTADMVWDLSAEANRRVAAGVYFVRARARLTGTGESVRRARVMVVK